MTMMSRILGMFMVSSKNCVHGVCRLRSPRNELILVKNIHNYVRPMLLALRYRKIRQEKEFPDPKKRPTHRNTFSDWNYRAELFAFGKRIGEDFDEALLRQAFTDSSYVTNEKLRQEELGLTTEALGLKDNDTMALEGQNILDNYLTTLLTYEFPLLPDDGIRSLRTFLMSEKVLAQVSSQIGTKDLIQCEEIPPKEETLTRAFLAIIAAVAQSSGQERVKVFIQDFVATQLCDKDVNEIWNIAKPWGMLTDILSSKGETFEPRLLREAGRNTLLSVFIVGLYNADKKLIGTGTGETVEIAQENAARDALSHIFGTRYPRKPFKFLSERSSSNQTLLEETTRKLATRN